MAQEQRQLISKGKWKETTSLYGFRDLDPAVLCCERSMPTPDCHWSKTAAQKISEVVVVVHVGKRCVVIPCIIIAKLSLPSALQFN